jgi:sporulation protein YlmC with PRC-barrel domain
MILSDLLGTTVQEGSGRRLGVVSDVRFVQGSAVNDLRLFGLLVSPSSRVSSFGYERRDVRAPALIARWERWRHRGMFLVLWEDVERLDARRVRLRAGFRRYSAMLPDA